ncbi:MAG TPA: ABC transporter permease [Candidatus Saccharimonadales bacterium]|nr:ABC transporter permease [Candidatus Saccharimonadales bacterium]
MRALLATTGRILQQLSHDHRTIGLLLFVPTLLMTLLRYMYDNQPRQFDSIGPMLLVIFPLVTMFLVTSIATLRERTGGTLERLLTLPMSKGSFMLGYALAFGIMATLQSAVIGGVSFGLLGLEVAGPVWLVTGVTLLIAVLGVALGLLASAFARSEFQAVQFMPAFVLPQLLLCGLLVARENMVDWLRWVSDLLPMTYAVEAMKELSTHTGITETLNKDLLILGAWVIGALLIASLTLRRRTK